MNQDYNNQFMQNFQMFLQQNPGMMGMMGMNNQGMMGMNNQGMMGMNNQGMMGMDNQGMMGMMGMNNQGMMGMNMFGGNNNVDTNYIRNMLLNMGYNEVMINAFINMYFSNNQPNQQIPQNPQNPQPQIYGMKNLVFKHKTTQNTVTIQANDDETLGSVINKYINKSGDNHINLYINNGKKLNESLTVSEAGLIDYCIIDVVATDELKGAFIK